MPYTWILLTLVLYSLDTKPQGYGLVRLGLADHVIRVRKQDSPYRTWKVKLGATVV